MTQRFQPLLAGKPVTRQTRDENGQPVYTIKAAVLTPFCKKLVDSFKEHVAAFLVLAVGLVSIDAGWNVVVALVLAGPAVLVYAVTGLAITMLLRSRTSIEMRADSISKPGLFGRKRFDRAATHSFALYVHDKAQKEQREQEEKVAQAAAKGKVLRLKPYYADSFHVVMIYGTRRVDLLQVYGIKDAEAVLQRLALCDGLLDEAIGMGEKFHGTGGKQDRGAGGFNQQDGNAGDAGSRNRAAGGF